MDVGMIAFFVVLALLSLSYAIFAPTRVEVSDESFRPEDYTPGMFDKYLRPAVRNFLPIAPTGLVSYARGSKGIASLLVRSGNPWHLSPEEYIILRVIAAAGGAAALSFYAVLNGEDFFLSPMMSFALGLAIGWMVPQALLSAEWGKRKKDLNKTLPEALDLLRICLNAGYNFSNALVEIVRLLPKGATQQELSRVVSDLHAGRTVNQSMKDFAERIPINQVESFVRAVNISQAMGTDMASTLSSQAAEARADYERAIDIKAQKLQTTLFLPIIALFLPCLLILIFGPSLADLGEML